MRANSVRGRGLHRRPVTGPVAAGLAVVLAASGLSASVPAAVRPSAPAVVPAAFTACDAGADDAGADGAPPALASLRTTAGTPLPEHQEIVLPSGTRPYTIAYDGAKLVVPPGAVRLPVGLGVSRLVGGEVPRLDTGMTNVTGRPRGGFRFTPHPMTFATAIEVTLPYDPALIPADFTPQDVYSYFYNDVAACWQALERVSVDEVNHTVTSLTDHFTDMINATVTVPEHPENVSFNPNQIKGIQAATPSSGVTLMAPPHADNQGGNQLSFPIEVPPGRAGLQPRLGIAYNSASAGGWLGVGWDLATPAIMIDTRWGVPRYHPGQETETYLLNGEQLSPVANRGTPQPRTAEKVFHTRVEGSFARIVRHGDGPKTYTWEVTDKSGIRSFYGALPAAGVPDPDATLADQSGNVFLWALREVRDPHGNFVRYHHARVDDTGVPGGTEPGRNLYPRRVTWTGSGSTEGRYAVAFVRDRERAEPARLDTSIDARGGFKRVTADLLRRVDVTLDGDLIRRYELAYTRGAFGKTLLRSIAQLDANAAPLSRHTFDYFDDIRDAQGNYQAFSPVPWTSPADNLSNPALNLTPDQLGNASALNANTSTSAGGHLYVGVGSSPSKSGSVGLKAGYSRGTSDGLLALVDVDGDSLPDKVFRSGGTVRYRKNLSGPHGQPRFADQSQPLALPAIQAESSNSLTLGIEAYPGGVAAQLDYVNTFATTSRYFSDVNADGISDLVTGSTVLFGRIGAGGVPVYGISADTPVPVSAGQVDTDLFDDFADDRERLIDSFPLLDSVRRWVAPFDGVVRITGPVRLAAGTAAARASSPTADGVRVAIQHEDAELWSALIDPQDNTEHAPGNVVSVTVQRGDRLYFRVQSRFDGALDEVSWDPAVSYLDVPGPLDVNGLPAYRFQASRDFTLGGRDVTVKAPLTGTLHLSGDLTKSAATTDDVTVVITRDGTPVLEQTLAAGSTGTVPVSLDITVQQGQTLGWLVRVDSPIDVDTISWVPRAFYTAADGVARVTDDQGNPLIDVFPPYHLDLYPVHGLTAPQGFYDVPDDGDLTVAPALLFDFDGGTPTASVTFTVKRRGALLAKRTFHIVAGAVSSPGPFTIAVDGDDELFFDFSTSDPTLREFLIGRTVNVTFGSNGTTEPAANAFHSTAGEGAFPQPYRGWGAIGYNGNRGRADQPIVQDALVIDDSYADQLPDSVDPQGQQGPFGQDPRIDPPKVVPFSPSPRHGRWGAGELSWVARAAVSSSRLGADSIDLPDPEDLAGATAVPRLARAEQVSLTGGVGGPVGSVGGSIATGDSTGQVDFVDMNGDGFPDVVTTGGIQYTDPTGGLGDSRGTLPDGAVRRSTNVSGNANAGSAARTITTGRGHAGPPGHVPANTAESGNDMPPLGVGGSIGGSSSDGRFDLLDVNGDGLPDRVYHDGRVALNLGYRFGTAEPWRNPAPLNDGTGTNSGLNLGFNTDFYGFAGGASYHESRTSTAGTLLDMNGDGLLDRVFAGNPITVGLNTGNGFEPPVQFRGSLAEINGDRTAAFGGGAYFTFSLCFLFACVIINPGAHVSTGVGRTEQALRDLNGDGFADHLSSTRDDRLVVAQNRTGRTNLLRTVSRPLGGRMDFDYQRDGNTYGQPQSRFVLSRVAVHDGHPGDGEDVQLVTYEYAGGVYDRLEREFTGYATVVERHRDPAAGEAVTRSLTREYRTDGHYTRGLLTRETTADAAGRPFTRTVQDYAFRDVDNPQAPADLTSTTATVFPQLVRTERHFFEGQANPGKTTFTTMEYDLVGNLTRSFDAGDDGTADDVDTRIGHTLDDAACQASYIVGVPNRIDVSGGGVLMRRRESTVDCATGDVMQVRARLANGESATTDLGYFANGNLRSVTGPANATNQRYRLDFGYDTVVDTHVESVTDSFGYQSRSTHDVRFGLVITSTDINQQVVRNSYDAAGRLATVTGPYEAPENRATIAFEYHPDAAVPHAVTRHVDRQADGTVATDTIDTVTFVDGLGRTIQTKMDASVSTGTDDPPATVMVVSGRLVHDHLGRVVKAYFPVTEPKGPANTTFNPAFDTVTPTTTTYDVLDRVTRTVMPDGTATTTSYGFGPDRSGVTRFETVDTDANGKSVRSYLDVQGRVTAVKEFNPAGGQPVIWTSFRHDALGERTAIVDDHNNTTTMAYDNLGRRTSVVSPDAGRTDTVYDLAGNMVKTITAKLAAQQQAIEYDYDFNRLTRIRYPVFPGNNVTYTYGGPGAPDNGANRVTGIVDGAGTVARRYGPLGEIVTETRSGTAQGSHTFSYTTQYRYDTWNRLLSMTYPDGEVLSYHYDSGGQVDRATGVKGATTYPYLTRLEYDKFGQRALVDTGNGTRTRYTYDTTNQRMTNMKANLAQGYVFQNLDYSYDAVGNVTSIHNDTVAPGDPDVGTQVGGPSMETFTYDDLYRLVHAEGSYAPRTPRIDRYRQDVSYDSISNITAKTQVHELVSGGNTTVDDKLSYTNGYAYSGPRPHAATTIGIQTFGYDANGNQISRNQQPQPKRQMIWDEENRLACSHENVQSTDLPQTPASCDNAGGTPNNARYFYDDQGNRVVKDGAQFHIYPNQNFSTRGNSEFKHVYIGTTKIVTKTVEPANRVEDRQFYSHGDHLGSTGFVTGTDGGLAEHLKYFPGGETWVSEHPSQPRPQQYTGKDFDPETKLYYFGARYYDPRTQAWQSPDPALPDSARGSKDLSTYLYAAANPMRYNDPDGRCPVASASSAEEETSVFVGPVCTPETTMEEEFEDADAYEHGDYVAAGTTAAGGAAGGGAGRPGRIRTWFNRSLIKQLFSKTLEVGGPDGGGLTRTYDKTGSVRQVTTKQAMEAVVEEAKPGGKPKGGASARVGPSGVLFILGVVLGLKADYDTYEEAKANGRTYSEEIEHRRNSGRKTIMVWPFPGLVLPGNEACETPDCII